MWHYGYGYDFFPFFPFMGILFWVFVFLLIFSLIRRGHRWHDHGYHEDKSPEEILAERYAKGEIDEKEYQKRLGVLKGHK